MWQLDFYAGRGSFSDYLSTYSLTDAEYADMERWVTQYLVQHPEKAAAFNADAWLEENLTYPPGNPSGKDNWFFHQTSGYTETYFQKDMRYRWLTGLYDFYAAMNKRRDFAVRYPAEFAAFDADAWLKGYYGSLGETKDGFLVRAGMNEEEFRITMFSEWADLTKSRANGPVVMVNGTPIQFQTVLDFSWKTAKPMTRNGRLLVPLRTVAEAMDFAVAYDGAAGTVSCTKEEVTVTFTLDSAAYSITSPGTSEVLSLDVPASAQGGRTYVPLRALGEALGYTVTWNVPFQTAILTAN